MFRNSHRQIEIIPELRYTQVQYSHIEKDGEGLCMELSQVLFRKSLQSYSRRSFKAPDSENVCQPLIFKRKGRYINQRLQEW